MLKKLSASTMLASALVLSVPMVANAFELTLSGDSEFKYETWSDDEDNTGGENDSLVSNESHVIIKAENTSDSGLTYGTYFRIEAETGNGGGSNLKEDGHRLYVKGDFGSITLGGGAAGDTYYADVLDRMVNDDKTSGVDLPSFGYFTAVANADETMSYHSPTLGGFKGGISFMDAGSGSKADAREIGLEYTADLMNGSVTLRYANGQKDRAGTTGNETSAQSIGVDVTSGAFGFAVSQNTKEDEAADGSSTADVSNTGFAATYQASDALKLALGIVSSEDEHDEAQTIEGDITAFSADYTIAKGLTAGLSYSSWEGQNTEAAVTDSEGNQSGTYTVLYMKVAF